MSERGWRLPDGSPDWDRISACTEVCTCPVGGERINKNCFYHGREGVTPPVVIRLPKSKVF